MLDEQTLDDLDRGEYQTRVLGEYNAEVARGITHTDAWKARMAVMQSAFNLKAYGTETPTPGSVVPATMVEGRLVPLDR